MYVFDNIVLFLYIINRILVDVLIYGIVFIKKNKKEKGKKGEDNML